MNVVLNGDNQVEALRPVALPPALSGDSCSILLRAKGRQRCIRLADRQNKEREKAGRISRL